MHDDYRLTQQGRLSILHAAVKLATQVREIGNETTAGLTLIDIARPIAAADEVAKGLYRVIRDLEAEPYRRGELPVIAGTLRNKAALYAADDSDAAPIATGFETMRHAEEYARANGMMLAVPERAK